MTSSIVFTIYQDPQPEDLNQAGLSTKEAFADWFAGRVAKACGCSVRGTYEHERVRLRTDEVNTERVSEWLYNAGFSHSFAIEE